MLAMNDPILFSVFFLFIIHMILFVTKAILNYFKSQRIIKNVYQKQFDHKDKHKPIFKYVCELIFTDPSEGFDTEKAVITLEVISTNEKSTKTKLATLELNFRDISTNCDLCCQQDFRGFFLIVRQKTLPPITYVRETHNSSKGIHSLKKTKPKKS